MASAEQRQGEKRRRLALHRTLEAEISLRMNPTPGQRVFEDYESCAACRSKARRSQLAALSAKAALSAFENARWQADRRRGSDSDDATGKAGSPRLTFSILLSCVSGFDHRGQAVDASSLNTSRNESAQEISTGCDNRHFNTCVSP